MNNNYQIRLVAGTSNIPLAQQIAKHLDIKLEETDIGRFADGETKIHIINNIRGADVFIIQPTCPPNVNDNLVELLLLINTLRLSSAKRITAVIPYYGYARQDQKVKPRVPISAAAVARLLYSMEVDRVLTLDLHCNQIQGFFPPSIPVDNLFAENEMIVVLRQYEGAVIVSPDAGGVKRARRIADKLGGLRIATILKRREVENQVASMEMVGCVDGDTCIIVDDMIDTAGTLCKAASLLKDNGALRVIACATHGVFSMPAMERIDLSCLETIYVTDSIPQEKNKSKKIQVVSVAPLLGKAISRLHREESLSGLFYS